MATANRKPYKCWFNPIQQAWCLVDCDNVTVGQIDDEDDAKKVVRLLNKE